MKYSFVATFKNRDEKRIRLFLNSLQEQSCSDFELLFINQGSDAETNEWLEKLIPEYPFIRYYHNHSEGFLWNKSNALNIGIKEAKGEYIIVADIDLVFRPDYLDAIGSILKPGLFITHLVYYIPQSFKLNTIKDVTTQLHNDLFEEGFHSACVASKEALMNIKGFDEFYLVWGVEDNDIIKRLEESGQLLKQFSAREINIYHQWHPSGSPGKPLAWYLLMVNHFYSGKHEDALNTEWGKRVTNEDRPILKFINDQSYKRTKRLEFWSDQTLLFFNPIMEGFHQLKNGEIAFLEYTYIPKVENKTKSITFFKRKKINNALTEQITKKDISQFFQFFIGYNRSLVQDYYYEELDNQFLFVCIKK